MALTPSLLLLITIHTATAYPGTFLIVADYHYDPTYDTTYESCNPGARVQKSDLGYYGHYECDPPFRLVTKSLEGMKTEADSTPDFLVWAGDNPLHVWNSTGTVYKDANYLLQMERNVTNAIDNTFPNTRVLPVLGNHDFFPKNQLEANPNEIYQAFWEMWKKWIPQSEKTTFLKGGYYSMRVGNAKQYTAVVLNNVLTFRKNKATENMDDPAGQSEWLQMLLAESRRTGEKVIIFVHVPIGLQSSGVPKKQLTDESNQRMVDILRSYSDIIIGVHAAHFHTDEFNIIYKGNRPVNYQLVTPSATPLRRAGEKLPGRNPTFRLVQYDTDKDIVTDYVQYYMELPKPQTVGDPRWKKLYNFRSAYGVQNLSPGELHKAMENIEKDASKLKNFQIYHTAGTNDGTCDCMCLQQHLCAMKNLQYADYYTCFDNREQKCGAPPLAASLLVFIMLITINLV